MSRPCSEPCGLREFAPWLDGLDPVEGNGLGRRDPQRRNVCQPFSDLWGPLLIGGLLNEYGIFWDF